MSKNVVGTIDITQATQHDSNYAKNSKLPVNKNEILICDLGYYNTKFFSKISKENFFISRVKTNIKFYQKDKF